MEELILDQWLYSHVSVADTEQANSLIKSCYSYIILQLPVTSEMYLSYPENCGNQVLWLKPYIELGVLTW